LEELALRGLALDVEMRTRHFPALLRLAERLPGLRLSIDHMARPDFRGEPTEEWSRGMESAGRLPQVFCKISGLLTEQRLPWSAAPMRPFVQHALAVFGPERLMFGSEWPLRLPDVTWKESLAAFTQSIGARSLEVREQLLGGTAGRFYGIHAAGRMPIGAV
jgi:L-fuconolactonase